VFGDRYHNALGSPPSETGVLAKAFANSIEAIEARNNGAAAMTSATVRAES
jgi:hypothetical protein